MKVSFELRKEKINANGLIPIQVVVRSDGERLRRNIGESVLEKYWNGTRAISNTKKDSYNRFQEINDKLVEIEERIRKISLYFTLFHFEQNKIF